MTKTACLSLTEREREQTCLTKLKKSIYSSGGNVPKTKKCFQGTRLHCVGQSTCQSTCVGVGQLAAKSVLFCLHKKDVLIKFDHINSVNNTGLGEMMFDQLHYSVLYLQSI